MKIIPNVLKNIPAVEKLFKQPEKNNSCTVAIVFFKYKLLNPPY